MMFDRSTKGDKSLDERWVRKAKIAKRTTSDLSQWSQREIERWDLDDPVREPTGKENPETYRYDKPLRRVNRGSDNDRRVSILENPQIAGDD